MATSPTALLDRAKGSSLTDIAKRGFGAWLLALATSAITGLQTFVELLLTPFRLLIDLAQASVGAFFLEPLGIVTAGAEASQQGVREFGIFGLLVAIAIVLAAFYMVLRYLQEEETSDLIPGFVSDALSGYVGVQEEADAED